MRMSQLCVASSIACAGLALAQPTPATQPAVKLDAVEQSLVDRPLASAVTELAKNAGDDHQRFALGIAQAFKAVENLQAGVALMGVRENGIGEYLPFLRLSHTPSTRPDQPGPPIGVGDALDMAGNKLAAAIGVPVTAKLIDDGLIRFRGDLAVALKTLDAVQDPNVTLTLPVLRTQFDLNGPLPGGAASLGDVLARLGVLGGEQPAAVADFTLHLDYGDVCWLRGYLHLLTAVTDLVLAYDKAELIDTCGDLIFERVAHSPTYPPDMRPLFEIGGDGIDIIDVVAFVHQLRLPVQDASQFAAARTELLATINESRASWASILKETDDDHEWIPNPNQQSVLPRMRVTPQIVENWYKLLDDGQAVLEGTKLVPFWRADDGRGINVKMLADKPPAFDPVMWVQGAPLGPYIQKGPLADGQSFRQLERLLEGNFFYFAAWVN